MSRSNLRCPTPHPPKKGLRAFQTNLYLKVFKKKGGGGGGGGGGYDFMLIKERKKKKGIKRHSEVLTFG